MNTARVPLALEDTPPAPEPQMHTENTKLRGPIGESEGSRPLHSPAQGTSHPRAPGWKRNPSGPLWAPAGHQQAEALGPLLRNKLQAPPSPARAGAPN